MNLLVSNKSSIVTACLVILSFLAITMALYFMRTVLVPFVFALFLYIVTSPLSDGMTKKFKFPKWLSITVVLFLILSLSASFVLLLGQSVKTLIQDSDLYQMKLISSLDTFTKILEQRGYGIDMDVIKGYLVELPILYWIKGMSGIIFESLTTISLIMVFYFFLMVGERSKKENGIFSQEIRNNITSYLMTKSFTSMCAGLSVIILFYIFQIPLAILFGVTTFLMHFIPNIGAFIAVGLPFPVILIQYGFTVETLMILIILSIIQFFIGNVLDPKLMGDSFGIHPVMIMLALLFWGFIWGIPGAFLAVPLTACIKLILMRYDWAKGVTDFLEGHF